MCIAVLDTERDDFLDLRPRERVVLDRDVRVRLLVGREILLVEERLQIAAVDPPEIHLAGGQRHAAVRYRDRARPRGGGG